MRAETLHSIAIALLEDFQKNQILKSVDQLVAAVEARISNASSPDHDKAVEQKYQQLKVALQNSATHLFTPNWRRLLKELTLELLLAREIQRRVDDAFQRRLVDSTLKEELAQLRATINARLEALKKLQAGFKESGVGDDRLAPLSYELNVAYPRESLDDSLSGFQKELGQLNRALTTLDSIVAQKQERLAINTLSSNDFQISIALTGDLTWVLLFVVYRLFQEHKRIREEDETLSKLSIIPEDMIGKLKDFSRHLIDEKIKQIITEIKERFPEKINGKEFDRMNDSVTEAINRIYKYIKNGVNIDIRVGPDPEEESKSEEAEKELSQEEKLRLEKERAAWEKLVSEAREIRKLSAELDVMKIMSGGILSLPEPLDEEDEEKTVKDQKEE